MKTEKICISKKNLVISLVVVLLLGVVGVSYMVQNKLTIRSKANEMGGVDPKVCKDKFDEVMGRIGKFGDNMNAFRDDFVTNAILTNGLLGSYCDIGNGHVKFDEYTTYTDKSEPFERPACCLRNVGVNSGKNRIEEMGKLGFKVENDSIVKADIVNPVDAKGSVKTIGSQNEGRVCIDRGAPVGSDDSKIPQSCGDGVEKVEECVEIKDNNFYPIKDSRRYFKVECGDKASDGQLSCVFQCKDKDNNWVLGCPKTGEEGKKICLPFPTAVPTLIATKPCDDGSKPDDKSTKEQKAEKKKNTCWVFDELEYGSNISKYLNHVQLKGTSKCVIYSKPKTETYEDCIRLLPGKTSADSGVCAQMESYNINCSLAPKR